MKRTILTSVVSAAALLMSGMSWADDNFPQEEMTVIIPFAPGDTDAMLRPFVERMGEFLGEPVVMDYRPGAGGALGAGEVARSEPNGYTMVGTSPGSVVVAPLANPDVPYSTDDFAPIAAISEGALMIMVQADSPFETLQDLVDHAQENPDDLTFGTSGSLGITHLLTETFAAEADIQMIHIPFEGSGPAMTALLGGHTDFATSAIAPAAGQIDAGAVRPLAVFAADRLDSLPDVPTVREFGIDVGSPTLYGLLAAAGTPDSVRQRLYEAAEEVLAQYSDELQERYRNLGAQVHLLGPDEYADYLAEQQELFTRAVALAQEDN